MSADQPDVLVDLQARFTALRATWGADDERDLTEGGDVNAEALKALGYTE